MDDIIIVAMGSAESQYVKATKNIQRSKSIEFTFDYGSRYQRGRKIFQPVNKYQPYTTYSPEVIEEITKFMNDLGYKSVEQQIEEYNKKVEEYNDSIK